MENQEPKSPKNQLDTATEPLQITHRAELLSLARAASDSPGVYLMKDFAGVVLYVGKAKNLKNRLATYFQAGIHERTWTELLVQRIGQFDVILTQTEAEALILEATLIKKNRPKFNIRLKDDKAYPYLKIQTSERFPRLEWTRRVQRDSAHYFGPFPSAWAAREVMGLLNETFQLRDCSDNTFRHRSRPCILFQMSKCTGPCVGKIDEAGYRESINQAISVLEGRSTQLEKSLRKGMDDAAVREEYEEAATYRDQLRNLEIVTQTQGVIDATTQKNRDVVGLARKGNDAHGTVLRVRGGRLIGVKHYVLQNADASVTDERVITDMLTQYYLGSEDDGDVAPSEVLVPFSPEEPQLLEQALEIAIRVPEPGTAVDEQLVRVARTNAEYALEQALKRPAGHGVQALEEIQEKLHLPRLPQRIECYDISNIQGEDAVASRVVFIDGAPDKNLYRRYKIRTVQGSNDFAMMREVLGRRFEKLEEKLPDLVVVDGGKGQLSQAMAILEELNVQGVAAVGLAKARTESDFQSSEVKSSLERIFIPGRKNPVPLLPHTAAFKLLTHVRDEAHRFAISYHRLLRDKRSLKSGE